VKYEYNTNIKWIGEKKGILKSKDKPNINVACPPEFGGHKDIWSPEDLFLASIEICTMTTFLHLIKKARIEINSYSSYSKGIAELVGNSLEFTNVLININIEVNSENDILHVKKLVKKLSKICLISNSVKTKIILKDNVTIA
jgi:organic hydroperoxide reductase OsmC/OhrA